MLEYLLLIFVSLLPIYYRYSTWLKVIQLKEYRIDRFREYISTKQGKNAIFNFWFLIELPILLMSFVIFLNPATEIIIFRIIFYFFVIQNIFVLGKIFRKQFILPKYTLRALLISFLLTVIFLTDVYFSLKYYKEFIYSLLMIYLFFPILIIFICNFITLPIINYKKNNLIKKAINKSNKNTSHKIGITGSYGKTSIKEYLYQITKAEEKNTLKTPENINTEMGVSQIVISKLKNKYKYFIAEMGAYKIGEIDLLGKIVNHRDGFLSAIGNQHIALFGSQKNIIKGKTELINSILKNNGILYYNGDNIYLKKYDFPKKLNKISYGLDTDNDIYSKIIGFKDNYLEFETFYNKKSYKFKTELLGDHNILNLTGITAFALINKFNINTLKKSIKNLKTPKNTLEIIKKSKTTIINDTYNLSVDGLLASIDLLKYFDYDNKILILDDILELGSESNIIHEKIGYEIEKKSIFSNIEFVGINYKLYFIKGLLKGGFDKNNICDNIELKGNKLILLEGRKANKYL